MRRTVIVTGSLGLIGYETTKLFLQKGYRVFGIDNDLRAKIFHIDTHYRSKLAFLEKEFPSQYQHFRFDIRNVTRTENLFRQTGTGTALVVHTAAQTSHDWARKDPELDFTVNAYATLLLLEFYRKYCPKAVFIFTSTNKVYGDSVNFLPLREYKTRYDFPTTSPYFRGIDEHFSVDHSTHSLFGVSKTAADLMVQEYGRYFGLTTGIFRLGVVTGEEQSNSLYQGFLTHIVKQMIYKNTIDVIGYKGKQVRDILHVSDLAKAFFLFFSKPHSASVYNLGGGRKNALSLLEIRMAVEEFTGKRVRIRVGDTPRIGDHKWWITNHHAFTKKYSWKPAVSAKQTIKNIINSLTHDS